MRDDEVEFINFREDPSTVDTTIEVNDLLSSKKFNHFYIFSCIIYFVFIFSKNISRIVKILS